jgi:hypothetical protein
MSRRLMSAMSSTRELDRISEAADCWETALTIILDGIDNQLLGNAVPSLMKEWNLPRGAFSTALATSPFGMMIGGAIAECSATGSAGGLRCCSA